MASVFKKSLLATAVIMLAAIMTLGSQPISAQGGQPEAPSANLQAFNMCTTTNYADVATKALGITAAELRKAIVNGQTLQDIAKSKNVDIQKVTTAMQAATKAAVDQAVKDGMLTQDEATALTTRASGPQNDSAPQGGAPQGGQQGGPKQGGQQGGAQQGGQQNNGTPQGNQPAGNPLPDISNLGRLLQLTASTLAADGQRAQGSGGPGMGGLGGSESFNVVKPYVVAAQSLNMTCVSLVKTLAGTSGKTIAAVAADQKIDTKTVTAALTDAYKNALTQDVKEGIITQAQFDKVVTTLDKGVADFINNAAMLRPGMMPAAPAK